MIGVLIVTHRELGAALIDAVEFITGKEAEAMAAVSIDINEEPEKLRQKIVAGIKEVDRRQGVLVLTDMFGGTPSNLSYSFLDEGRVEVISGVNLPMVIKAESKREELGLSELAPMLEAFGKRSISLASGILRGNKRSD
jgi:PTS system mannose-specific IIA component